MAIEYFNAYHSYLKSIEPLNDAERGRLFTALLKYSSTGEVPDIRGNERFIFPTMKEQIDRDKQKYDAKCKKQAEKAKKRWDAESCHGMPEHAEACQDMPNDADDAKAKTKAKTKEKTKEKANENNNPFTPSQEEKFSPLLLEAVRKWLRYKHERKEDYTPTGLEAMTSEIRNRAADHGDSAVIDLIEQCMAANWKGIVWDKLSPSQKGNPKYMPGTGGATTHADESAKDDLERMQQYLERQRRGEA